MKIIMKAWCWQQKVWDPGLMVACTSKQSTNKKDEKGGPVYSLEFTGIVHWQMKENNGEWKMQ